MTAQIALKGIKLNPEIDGLELGTNVVVIAAKNCLLKVTVRYGYRESSGSIWNVAKSFP